MRLIITLVAAGLLGCSAAPDKRLVPSELQYLSRADWGAKPPVLPMREHVIQRLTIHHTGVAQAPARSTADKLRGLQAFSQRDDSLASGLKKPAWADVPYHFYIGYDGAVAEAREWRFVGDSNTPYDPSGHLLVVVEGRFDTEQPMAAQMRSLELLVTALVRRFNIPAENIGGHRDFATTSCPGKNLYDDLPRLRTLAGAASQ